MTSYCGSEAPFDIFLDASIRAKNFNINYTRSYLIGRRIIEELWMEYEKYKVCVLYQN